MSKTEQNLEQAFAGESQANRKYLAFAEQAEKEGHRQEAKLFRAAARAETVHAHSHLRALGGVKSTEENLKAAAGGEAFEFQSMYPPMIEEAEAEGKQGALRSFRFANAVEEIHHGLFEEALKNIGRAVEVDYFVCRVCGNTVEKEPPETCAVCGAKRAAFEKVE